MIIKRLTASFGKLSNATLDLERGLNIVEAPNEAGKSTWCAFIRSILYGINTSDRDKTGYLSDKTRFRPWSGSEMNGSADIAFRDHDITIQRTALGRSPMKNFKAVYTGTAEDISYLNADNAGETLTGVSEQVFRRSAFIGQSGLRISQEAELEKRISSLVSTGDENTSYTESDIKLRAWQRRLRYKTSGTLPKLEKRLLDLETNLDSLQSVSENISEMRSEILYLENQKKQLEQDIEAFEKLDRLESMHRAGETLASIEKFEKTSQELRSKLDALEKTPTAEYISEIRADLSAMHSFENILMTAKKNVDEARAQYLEVRSQTSESEITQKTLYDAHDLENNAIRAKTMTRISFVACAIIILLAVITAIFAGGVFRYAAIAIAILSTATTVIFTVLSKKRSGDLTKFLSLYNVTTTGQLQSAFDGYIESSETVDTAKAKLDEAEYSFNSSNALCSDQRDLVISKVQKVSPFVSDIDSALSELDHFSTLLSELEYAESQLESARKVYDALPGTADGVPISDDEVIEEPALPYPETVKRLERVSSDIVRLNEIYNITLGESKSLGDPVILGSEILQLRQLIDQQTGQYDALSLAIDTLHESNTGLQIRFSPLLGKTASKIFSRITGGRYESLIFDRSLDASATASDEGVTHNVLELSEGTTDQIYLALRLAICELVLPTEELCPIILDDALANTDDVRAALALDFLKELANDRQIILFTCHSREADHFAGDSFVNVVKI